MSGDKFKQNILILTSEAFPVGGAAANRNLTLSKGLILQGQGVEVLCLRPADYVKSPYSNLPQGELEGVSYKYIHNRTQWPTSVIKKISILISQYHKLLFQIWSKNNKSKIDVILIAKDDWILNLELYLIAKVIKCKVILVLDEFPPSMRYQKLYVKILGKITNSFRYRFCDGMILMTETLIKHYKKLTRPKTRVMKLPMSVEIDRFLNVAPRIMSKQKYIIYCGLEPEIDGLGLLLQAFLSINQELPDLRLLIIGDSPDGQFDKYHAVAQSIGLQNKVVFKGRVARNEIPAYLQSAHLLALTRITTTTALGGFPTKLGEYLATKKPVLVTNTGEIGSYLQDNISCYLIKPGNVEEIAEKIKFIFKNYEEALKVGEQGYKVACDNFDYKVQAKELANFIKTTK